MPIYDYICLVGHEFEKIHSIAACEQVHLCPECDLPAKRQMSAPRVFGDFAGYTCPITGKWIEGRRAHEENLKEHGCRLQEPGEKEDWFKERQREEDRLVDRLADDAVRLIDKMPKEKQEVLAGELVRGGDVEQVRL